MILFSWGWLNQNAWCASALLAVGFAGAAVTMWWHMKETHGGRHNYLVVAGLAVLAGSFVLVGVSVGDQPILDSHTLIPAIRVMWFIAAVLLNSYLVVYWAQRVKWNGWMGWRRMNSPNRIKHQWL